MGKYLNYWGVHQIADLLQKVGVSEEHCFAIGESLSKTWFSDLCSWVYLKRKRDIKIHIDNYDVWNMAETLATIILPMLEELRETKNGSPHVDKEDMPFELQFDGTEAFSKQLELFERTPEYNERSWNVTHDRWNYVLSEMIWTFTQLQPDCDWEADYYDEDSKLDLPRWLKHHERINNGTKLFGKYYQGLWD